MCKTNICPSVLFHSEVFSNNYLTHGITLQGLGWWSSFIFCVVSYENIDSPEQLDPLLAKNTQRAQTSLAKAAHY